MRCLMALLAQGTMALILVASLYTSVSWTTFGPEIPSAFAASTMKSVKSGLWSEPATWDAQRIPSTGDNVIISTGTVVTYDVNSNELIGEMMIEGKLTFSTNKSTQLVVSNIMVHASGVFEMGTKQNPIPRPHTATLQFVVRQPGEQGLMMMGRGDIHGAPIKNTFTKLTSNVNEGATKLIVKDDVQDWQPGSKIVITATGERSCTELNSVSAVSDRTITLKDELRCDHDGIEPTRADVALLTRNVLITSKVRDSLEFEDDFGHPGIHERNILELNHGGGDQFEGFDSKLRAHTMFMQCGPEGAGPCSNAGGGISYAEFFNLGPEGKLGRYPIHFHEMGDSAKGILVQGNAIWNSANRWITLHSSNGITLKDNVGFGSVGHGYFLEHGNEVNNIIDHNIGIAAEGGELIPSDETPAVFWMQNPVNTWTNNIAVQGGYYGFHFDVPDDEHDEKDHDRPMNLGSLAIQKFENNESHNNGVYGLRTSAGHASHEDEHDESHEVQVRSSGTIDNFLSWRNGYWGIRLDGVGTQVTDSIFIGNKNGGNIGFEGAYNIVRNSQALGEVNNGNNRAHLGVVFEGGDHNVIENSIIKGHGETGIMFRHGHDNIVKDSTLDQRVLFERNGSKIELSLLSADVMLGHDRSTGSIINTQMLSPRTIIFGISESNDSYLVVQNYMAPNDNHGRVPNSFSLWSLDTDVLNGVIDPYFVAIIGPVNFEIVELESGKKVIDKSILSPSPSPQPSPSPPPQSGPINAVTDSTSYDLGDIVKITGSVSSVTAQPVVLRVYNPDNDAFRFDQVAADNSGSFTYDFELAGERAKTGTYEIEVAYFDSKQTIFINVRPSSITTSILSVSNAHIVDALGSSVSTASVDQQVLVQGEISNHQETGHTNIYIVQIKDSKDIVVSLSWMSGFINPHQSITSAQSWVPHALGTYKAQIFVWQSIDDPLPLSSVTELAINVS